MLIYEKDNKLNINFENSVDVEPDLQIGKDGDKTEVLIDGQPSGSSGCVVNFTYDEQAEKYVSDKSNFEILEALSAGQEISGYGDSMTFPLTQHTFTGREPNLKHTFIFERLFVQHIVNGNDKLCSQRFEVAPDSSVTPSSYVYVLTQI